MNQAASTSRQQPQADLDPSPEFDSIMDERRFISGLIRDEIAAYRSLVSDGGRPSHPVRLLKTIVFAPGEYRSILSFWQGSPNEWTVFGKQLQRWLRFREYQKENRVTRRHFTKYVKESDERLAWREFDFPPPFPSAKAAFKYNPSDQDEVATWIEYVTLEYRRLDQFEAAVRKEEEVYNKAWDELLVSGVLEPHERSEEMVARICSPTAIETTRRMHERHRYFNLSKPGGETLLDGTLWAESEGSFWRLFKEDGGDSVREAAKRELKRIDRRTDCVADFRRKTELYRACWNMAEHHQLLVSWVLEQMVVLEREHAGDAAQPTGPPTTFPRFVQLPTEIRHAIWDATLPSGPLAHFFDVVDAPRPRHLAQRWATREFRVCATRAHDSGYLAVHALRRTCRDARDAVAAHYARIHRTGVASLSFETFDWIPPSDLVVLCFPPVTAAGRRPLPGRHALAFDRGQPRKVGVLVPREYALIQAWGRGYDGGRDDFPPPDITGDTLQSYLLMSYIPKFLDALRLGQGRRGENNDDDHTADGCGGIRTVHLIVEGVHADDHPGYSGYDPIPSKNWARLNWHSPTSRGAGETCFEWRCYDTHMGTLPDLAQGRFEDRDQAVEDRKEKEALVLEHRAAWGLRSSWWQTPSRPEEDRQFLVEPAGWDSVERSPMRHIVAMADQLERDLLQMQWEEFVSAGVLGVVYKDENLGLE